ncbi:MAG: c-type cytochrome biogenesis protein CcmF, partial [Candidatus Zixiibacteriota bacterium]
MHPAHLGDFFLFSATALSFVSLVVYVLAWRGKTRFVGLGRKLFALASVCVTLALGTLLYLILSHDFSVAYVFSYSSTDLP